jgi:hypothetical protein
MARRILITDEEIRGACFIVNIREALERIDKKLDKQLRPKRKRKTA